MGIFHNGSDYPWWKFVNRPVPLFEEVKLIKERIALGKNVGFMNYRSVNIEYNSIALERVQIDALLEEEMISGG